MTYSCFCLAEAIQTFMDYYRATFPNASITLKLHLLEDHVVPFIERWNGVGFGLLGEQGAESIHARFNNLKRQAVGIRKDVDRLKSTLKAHLLQCSPANIIAKPPAKKRKIQE